MGLIGELAYDWHDKEKRAVAAKNHTEEMQKNYSADIAASVKAIHIYSKGLFDKLASGERVITNPGLTPKYSVKDIDSVSAVLGGPKDICVLNFASYKNPGGMFLKGSRAQEESLCHESFLYNVLSDKRLASYYEYNNKHLNKAFYEDRAVYTPGIRFSRPMNPFMNKVKIANVITCAAPNIGAVRMYNKCSKEEERTVLHDRIRLVLAVAAVNGQRNLVLGAFGCGVFKCDPVIVAEEMKNLLEGEFKGCFEDVCFAIPSGNNKDNFKAFEDVFVPLEKKKDNDGWVNIADGLKDVFDAEAELTEPTDPEL